MPTFPRFSSLLLTIPFASLVACQWNEVETGKNGLVELIPSECGQLGCDLDEGIAVGGSLSISLRGTEGRSAADLTLISSAPWVIDVLSVERFGAEPTFQVVGTGSGLADLIIVDRAGYEIDYLPVDVSTISTLELAADAPDLIERAGPNGDRVLEAAAGATLALHVDGYASGRHLMGDVQFLVELDQAIAQAMAASSDVARGEMTFAVPAGEHALVVTAPGGTRQRVVILGR